MKYCKDFIVVKNEIITPTLYILRLQYPVTLPEIKPGQFVEILVEGVSKRSKEKLFGRTSQNKVVIFDNKGVSIGNYVNVKIEDCTSATLIGQLTDK